jgi:hypothetical protein
MGKYWTDGAAGRFARSMNRSIIPCSIKLGGMRVTFLKRRSWMNTTDF